jgi:ketosteroid isomerase-like protein
MDTDHPNIQLMKRLDLGDLASARDLFAENVVWHYFNPNLPEVQGDYVGLNGIRSFFQNIGGKTRGMFKVEPISITAVGDELVVVHARDTLTFQGRPIALDVVVVWRFVDGRIAEVWDIVPGQPTEGNDAGH